MAIRQAHILCVRRDNKGGEGMIEVLQIIAYLVCVFISTYGVFAVAGILKEIKDTQKNILHEIDIIQLQLSDGKDGE